jgi:hypothetical protein
MFLPLPTYTLSPTGKPADFYPLIKVKAVLVSKLKQTGDKIWLAKPIQNFVSSPKQSHRNMLSEFHASSMQYSRVSRKM